MFADPHVRKLLLDTKSVTVGTADAEGVPTACRAVCLHVVADGGLTVYLPIATAARTIANLATNGRIAIVSSNPADNTTVQVKGRSRAVRVARDEERGIIEAWHSELVERLAAAGMPRSVTLGLTRWPAFAVEVEVAQFFEQTPGPRAGDLMRER